MPTYSGRIRVKQLSEESYAKHKEVVEAWLDGHKVETYFGAAQGWLHIINPHFDVESEYRVAKNRENVLPDQVWKHKKTETFTVKVFGLGLGVVYYVDKYQYNHVCSVEEFYERYTQVS